MSDEKDEKQSLLEKLSLEPIEIAIPSGVEYSYPGYEHCPVIQLRHFHRDRNGNLLCELSAFCVDADIITPVVGVRWNLSSLTTRKQLANGIKDGFLDTSATWMEWDRLLADTALRALKFYRGGREVEDIWPVEEIPQPAFLIDPVLPLHQPTILFGDGGSGKGHLAMTLALISQLPWGDNPLGLTPLEKPTNCLYLDYESDRGDFERILSGLCLGLGINIGVKRLPMGVPLADYTEQLGNRISEDNIGLLVVDSLGLAAGGNINDAEQAIRFYGALRQLENITTLIIAHNSKDPLNKTKSVFGSVFFSNLARSVWEVKKSQEPDSPEMAVSLKHKKFNRKQRLPLGFRYTFDDESGAITVARQDLSNTELSGELPLYLQIKNLLLDGALTKSEIAEALGLTEAQIKQPLYKHKGLFINIGGGQTWGVIAEPEGK